MWRLVSLGQRVGEGQEAAMSPSPGDEAHSHQDSNPKSTGGSGAGSGLASVFKGLAGAAKLSKSTSVSLQSSTSINAQIAQHLSASSSAAHSLPQHHAEAFEQLKNGPMSERVAAAHTLRYTVADYPLNPVCSMNHFEEASALYQS